MITDAIHDYVAGQLSGLWSLPKPQRRARLAELRRGVGHQPGDLPALWGSFLQELPKELWGRETAAGECREPSEAEWAVYLALTLYALHQQGEENVSMNEKGCTLGRAVRLLAQNSAAAAQDSPRAASCAASTHWPQRIPCPRCPTTSGDGAAVPGK